MNLLTRNVRTALLVSGLVLGGLGVVGFGPSLGTGKVQAQARQRTGNERHPHIRKAINDLKQARTELKEAAHDFGGHRQQALDAVDNASKQLETCLKYDKQ
jgi:hypothetical protein